MKPEITLKEKGQSKLKEWKQLAKELSIQLHLEAAETKEEFEKQKKRLGEWVDSLIRKLDNARDVTKEKAESLKSSLEELQAQAKLGKAETEDHYWEQQRKIALGLQKLKQKLSNTFNSAKDGAHDFVEEVSDQLDDFHTRFDLFWLELHHQKIASQEEWDKKKKELSHRLSMVKAKLHDVEKTASEKWEVFLFEITEAWGHFKKAFK